MRVAHRLIVSGLTLLGILVLSSQPAAASCAQEAGPDGSPVIFVGTPQEERRGFTRFSVEQVRAGPDLAPEVWVRSGQEQSPWPLSLLLGVSSSVDAEFVDGRRYVVGASDSFGTNACTIAEAAGRDQQTDVRRPVQDGATGADPPIGPVGQGLSVAAALAGLVVGVGLLLRRRLSRPG